MAIIQPEQLAKSGTEHGHQAALFCWAAIQMQNPKYACLKWMHAIPNGGDRNQAVASQLKAEGVRSGIWDVCLPVAHGGWFGLYIEMKKPAARYGDQRDLSDNQRTFGLFAHKHGYKTEVCHSWEKAQAAIMRYLAHPPTQIQGDRK